MIRVRTLQGATLRSEFTAFQAEALKHAANYESEGTTFQGVPSSKEARYNESKQVFTVLYKRGGELHLQDAKGNVLKAAFGEDLTSAPKAPKAEETSATTVAAAAEPATETAQTNVAPSNVQASTAAPGNNTLAALASVVANLSASEYERGRQAAAGEISELRARIDELQGENERLQSDLDAAAKQGGTGTTINIHVPGRDTITSHTEKVVHPVMARVLRYVAAGENVYMYGPAGAGKNVICEQVAEALGVPFYYQNTILSKHDLSGYVEPHSGELLETPFFKAAKGGGVYMLDEVDNCTAEAMIALNAALANGYYTFPKVGKVKLHPDFHCVAAGNTAGLGATADFCGRYKLDESSRDRFTFVEVDYCPEIENSLAGGNSDILDFVRGLRKASKSSGVYVTAGYRLVKRLATFADGDKVECINDFVFRGLDIDAQTRLRAQIAEDGNPYNKALREAVAANEAKLYSL